MSFVEYRMNQSISPLLNRFPFVRGLKNGTVWLLICMDGTKLSSGRGFEVIPR